MNNSTTITLNDRFSMIKKPIGFQQVQGQPQRGRSRSRSRGRSQQQQKQPIGLHGSRRNQKLLDQLEKQHKMRLAMKLKNKSILRSRGRAQGQIVRNGAKRAATIKKAVNVRNLKRSNSLTTFVPLNDGPRRNFRGRSRSRSQSRNRAQQGVSITDRLGVRRGMRRGQSNGAQQQQQGQQQRSRSRTRSRVRLNRNNFNNRNGNGNNQAPLKRSNSAVNPRLGNNGPAQIRRRRRFASNTRNPNTQMNKPLAGRIVKRNPKPVGGRGQVGPRARPIGARNQRPVGARAQRPVRKNGNALGVNARNALGPNGRRGKAIKRGNNAPAQTRGRVVNRAPNQAGQGGGHRGRSRTRRGANNNQNNSRGGAGGNKISQAQLDKQIDDYMSKGSA